MTILELSEHPELASLVAAVQRGEPVEIVDHGRSVARCMSSAPASAWSPDLFAFRRAMRSPVHPGNSVVEARQDERF